MAHLHLQTSTSRKKSNRELDPWIENPRPFTKADKLNLRTYVK